MARAPSLWLWLASASALVLLLMSMPKAPNARAPSASAQQARARPPAITQRQAKAQLSPLAGVLAAGVVALTPTSASATTVFEGKYADPNHPGCARAIAADGTVTGADGTPGCLNGEKQTKWQLQGKIDGEKIFIDFSPKGGPKDLVGEWREDVAGVRFPDGNVWSKL